MIELFKLLGTVAIDNSEAIEATKETAQEAEQAGNKISTAFEKVGSVAVAVGKTVAAGLAVGATAITALAKNALDGYADYEQLVGGVETLFKDSASKVVDYANKAYETAGMSANEYMATVTSFSASLLQSLASGTSEAGEMSVEATMEALEQQYTAVEEANEKKLELLEEAHESELEAFEELTEQKIELINEQYKESLKLIDEEKYNKIKAIDEQIDALNAQTQAERDAIAQREQERKKAALQEKIDTAETYEKRLEAQQDLNEYLAELEQDAREKQRKAQIEALKEQKDVIKEEADAKKDAAKEQYNAEVKAAKKESEAVLKEMKKGQEKEMKALKKANKAQLEETAKFIEEQTALLESSSAVEYSAETYAKAAEKANQAIIDMSDNANKMGTSMESIQNAYQGFAKQNFTMLDNLKLGYGGTKTEMERLLRDAQAISGIEYDVSSYADIVDAIHVIQTEMGITGTTAEEASKTISGSFSALKSAWANLIAGFGNEEADLSGLVNNFTTSLETYLNNAIPRIAIILSSITDAMTQMLPIVAAKLPELLNELLPSLITGATALLNGFILAMPSILQIFLEQLPMIFSQVSAGFVGAFPVLLDTMKVLFAQIWDYISLELLNTGVSFEDAFNKMSEIFNKAWGYMQQVWEDYGKPIWDYITAIVKETAEKFTEFSESLRAEIGDVGEHFNRFSETVEELIGIYLENLMAKFESLVYLWETYVIPVIALVVDAFGEIVESIISHAEPAVQNIMDAFVALYETIENAVETYILPTIELFIEMMKELYEENKDKLNLIGELFEAITEFIERVVQDAVDWFNQNLLPFIELVVEFIKTHTEDIKAVLQKGIDFITGIIETFIAFFRGDWEGMWESIKATLQAGVDFINGIFETLETFLRTILEKIGAEISEEFGKIYDSIVDKLTEAKDKAVEIFDSIKESIAEKINNAKEAVKKALDSIKSFFNFEVSLPHIALPHFSISPSGWQIGDLLEGSIPTLGIDWYAKGGVMEEPTVFGVNGNKLMAGGEAGPEAIAPIAVLQDYIAQAVAAQNAGLVMVLERILDAIIAMDENMGGNLREALEGTALEVNHREFGRLVKAVN